MLVPALFSALLAFGMRARRTAPKRWRILLGSFGIHLAYGVAIGWLIPRMDNFASSVPGDGSVAGPILFGWVALAGYYLRLGTLGARPSDGDADEVMLLGGMCLLCAGLGLLLAILMIEQDFIVVFGIPRHPGVWFAACTTGLITGLGLILVWIARRGFRRKVLVDGANGRGLGAPLPPKERMAAVLAGAMLRQAKYGLWCAVGAFAGSLWMFPWAPQGDDQCGIRLAMLIRLLGG